MPLNDDRSPGQLWVCWTKPKILPSGDVPVLSFLPPACEEDLQREHKGPVIFAREASLAVRSDARELYVNLVARIGIVQCRGNLTLRQVLSRPGNASLWWYHPVAFKDCESDPTFNWIIALLTIRAAAEKYSVNEVVVFGAPSEVVHALKSLYQVHEHAPLPKRLAIVVVLRGLMSRAAFALKLLYQIGAIRRHFRVPEGHFDVVFSGFWDWSVGWNYEKARIDDRYFKRLPDELQPVGVRSVGWMAWLDPHSEPGSEGRRLKDVLGPLKHCKEVVILQAFLRPRDVLRAVLDFGPFVKFLRLRRHSELSQIFRWKGFDFYALFSGPLLLGFLDASLPYCELVALGTKRACQRYRPQVSLSFLEHFPYSRAHYEGARQAGTGTTRYAVQHASYSHEKTFLLLHPSFEFKGEPDACAAPHPDYVCVMGTLGKELFLECGYQEKHVFLTGSPRYEHIDLSSVSLRMDTRLSERNKVIRLLMICSLNVAIELEMVDAVCSAVSGVDNVELFLRNHPFRRIEQDPGFVKFKDRIQVTQGSLEEDLSQADLVFFSYSTVAEEAFLKGKPVWQWLPTGFNGSALAEVVAIPQFGSVVSLRRALRDFYSSPDRYLPSPEIRQVALERLFYCGDGGAASRISKIVKGFHLVESAQGEGKSRAVL